VPAETAPGAEIRATRRDSAIAEVMAGVPPSARRTLAKALEGKASPRAAIKAHCLLCVNFDRQAVRACPVLRCALWHYRPFAEGGGG